MTQATIDGLIEYGAWPLAIAVVCIAVLVIFRNPIVAFIGRITGISSGKAKVDLTTPHQQATPPPGSEEDEGEGGEIKGASKPDHLRVFDNRLVVEVEQIILNDPSLSSETDQQRREELLVRHLAATQIREYCERTYREIWGSQLKALQYLAGFTIPVNKSVVQFFYDEASKSAPLLFLAMDFDQWLNFFVAARLITMTNDEIAITVAGREFLKYLIDRGYSVYKGG